MFSNIVQILYQGIVPIFKTKMHIVCGLHTYKGFVCVWSKPTSFGQTTSCCIREYCYDTDLRTIFGILIVTFSDKKNLIPAAREEYDIEKKNKNSISPES